MFSSVLVANRGEIGVRIIRTLRKMGIRAVVVASIPDRRSLAVRSADACVLLEGSSAAESYLDIDAVITAAKAQHCEAIHPGYGFLSERADFAERCAAEGIVFVGPPPAVLRGMGDKAAARRLAVENGVPVVPGWDGDDDDATLIREAAAIGFPIMVKAKGGGGGRGMREVHRSAELPEALASARREAQAAFGDPGLLLERLVTGAHHVEVQVLADAHGNVIHLGERDCSVQRRHQKLIEETPGPVVDDALRAALTDAALALARAINYVNAGTFEFLVGGPAEGGRPFYFLEVNPRLQVEHPVTEAVTGLDLVELQVRIAAGEALPLRQDEVHFNGHAIEFRINAEDPADAFQPQSGRIRGMVEPPHARFDPGYASGDVVPSQYDSLVAKLVVHDCDRDAAVARAAAALDILEIRGVKTNAGLHRATVAAAAWRAGEATVDWIEPALPGLLAAATVPATYWAAAAAGVAMHRDGDSRPAFAGAQWLGAGDSQLWLSDGTETRALSVRLHLPGSISVVVAGETIEVRRLAAVRPSGIAVSAGGSPRPLSVVAADGDSLIRVFDDDPEAGTVHSFRLVLPPPLPRQQRAAVAGATVVTAPLAGTISAIRAAEGEAVEAGALLILLEAMKMEHRIVAPTAGRVKAAPVRLGDVVREGDVLMELG